LGQLDFGRPKGGKPEWGKPKLGKPKLGKLDLGKLDLGKLDLGYLSGCNWDRDSTRTSDNFTVSIISASLHQFLQTTSTDSTFTP
jgi:hypothetical protein